MDPMKSRRWIAAAALAAAAVFLVMITGERAPGAPQGVPAPVSSSGAVLASDGGPPDDATGADRAEVIEALQGLLDALGISAQELADCAGAGDAQSDDGDDGGNGGGDCGTPGAELNAEPAGGTTITITAFAFGQPLTVAPGAKVTVVNTDAAPHNVTAADGKFETPDLAQDETASFTAPTAPGRYEFTCTLHPEMTGTLIVADAAAGSGTGDRTGEPDRNRTTEPAGGRERGAPGAGTSGDENDDARQHRTTAPSTGRGTSDGY